MPLPNVDGSLKIGVLGDFGDGEHAAVRDGRADGQEPRRRSPTSWCCWSATTCTARSGRRTSRRSSSVPYKPLLDAGVKFYASLGNHDSREQRYYKPFNMDGKLYYSFKGPKQSVRFIALESTYPEPVQIAWLEQELKSAREDWKIVFFHHPLYSSGERHGSDTRAARHAGAALRRTTASASSSPGTTTSTSASSRRRAFSTSWSDRAAGCAEATSIAAAGLTAAGPRHRQLVSRRRIRRRSVHVSGDLAHRQGRRFGHVCSEKTVGH